VKSVRNLTRRRCEMKFVVVYESMFGNTETIAKAIAAGLSEAGEVKLGTVDALSPEEVQDAALFVAGGPTHAHGMARRKRTRPSPGNGRTDGTDPSDRDRRASVGGSSD